MMKVIKIGGGIIDSSDQLHAVLDSIVHIQDPVVLVHGGGRVATDLAHRLGVEQQLVNGRRVTDQETLQIVTMTYAGWINKTIVAGLQSRGVQALGLTGVDLDLITSRIRSSEPIDYGFVGDPVHVNASVLRELLSIQEQRTVLVVAPITHDGQGTLLNTNADTIATEIASACAPNVELTFVFDLPGVLTNIEDPGSLIRHIDKDQADRMVASGEITTGMLPKIENALRAVERGVALVRIARYDALNTAEGTWIS